MDALREIWGFKFLLWNIFLKFNAMISSYQGNEHLFQQVMCMLEFMDYFNNFSDIIQIVCFWDILYTVSDDGLAWGNKTYIASKSIVHQQSKGDKLEFKGNNLHEISYDISSEIELTIRLSSFI